MRFRFLTAGNFFRKKTSKKFGYLEEEVKPNMVEPEPTFDPLDKSQVDLGDLVGDWG